jgi:hypothetical protein
MAELEETRALISGVTSLAATLQSYVDKMEKKLRESKSIKQLRIEYNIDLLTNLSGQTESNPSSAKRRVQEHERTTRSKT